MPHARLRTNFSMLKIIGAGDEARTRDPQLGKLMLYQLSYTRIFIIIRLSVSFRKSTKTFFINSFWQDINGGHVSAFKHESGYQ